MTACLMIVLQVLLLILAAPLASGFISKLKNYLRMRQGPSVFQPYYNLVKLFSKSEIVSEHASWIFKAAPFVVLASVLCVAVLIPIFSSANLMGDFLVLLFVFALGRFFLALAALDTASAFGGMGSSREMFISSLAEPIACLAVFAIALKHGSTNLSVLFGGVPVSASALMAAAALLMVVIAETSRLPIDNQETHLELTMVHEAMVLEYSGKSLALIEWASHIKQLIWFVLIAMIFWPGGGIMAGGFLAVVISLFVLAAKVAFLSGLVAGLEIVVAKMRLFRAVDFFTFGFAMAILAVACSIWGV